MERDMDLFRKVLLEIEKIPPGQWKTVTVAGATPEEVRFHAQLADDAKFIEARFMKNTTTEFVATRLTYAGTEFLAAARNDTLWSAAKKKLMSTAGVITVEGLKVALPEIISKMIQ